MIVQITAKVRKGDEDSFRQAIEDGDFSWMQELSPYWLEVEELSENK